MDWRASGGGAGDESLLAGRDFSDEVVQVTLRPFADLRKNCGFA
jgi:hypothetical protein